MPNKGCNLQMIYTTTSESTQGEFTVRRPPIFQRKNLPVARDCSELPNTTTAEAGKSGRADQAYLVQQIITMPMVKRLVAALKDSFPVASIVTRVGKKWVPAIRAYFLLIIMMNMDVVQVKQQRDCSEPGRQK